MNKIFPTLIYSVFIAGISMFSLSAYALGEESAAQSANASPFQGPNAAPSNNQEQGKGMGQRMPPKEAIDACAGKAASDACSFTGRMNNTVEGTCRTPPKGQGQLVCMPKPPQQAFDACNGKAEGDACSFTNRMNKTVEGACKKPPVGDEKMVCRPMRGPGQEGQGGQRGQGGNGGANNPPPAPK